MIAILISICLLIIAIIVAYLGYKDSLKDYTLIYDAITATITNIIPSVKIDKTITPIKPYDYRVFNQKVSYSYKYNGSDKTGYFYNNGSTSEEWTSIEENTTIFTKNHTVGSTFTLYINKNDSADITINPYHSIKNIYYSASGTILCIGCGVLLLGLI